VIEPFRVSTEAIRESVAWLPDAGRRGLATALQALSQLVAVKTRLVSSSTSARSSSSARERCCSRAATADHQVVDLLWLG
jgi:hypothetical protein